MNITSLLGTYQITVTIAKVPNRRPEPPKPPFPSPDPVTPIPPRKAASRKRFTSVSIRNIRSLVAQNIPRRDVALQYGVHVSTIGDIVRRDTHKDV